MHGAGRSSLAPHGALNLQGPTARRGVAGTRRASATERTTSPPPARYCAGDGDAVKTDSQTARRTLRFVTLAGDGSEEYARRMEFATVKKSRGEGAFRVSARPIRLRSHLMALAAGALLPVVIFPAIMGCRAPSRFMWIA